VSLSLDFEPTNHRRPYFQALGLISFFSYYITTLKHSGLAPLVQAPRPNRAVTPLVYPPLPVRYFRQLHCDATIDTVLKAYNQIVAGTPAAVRTSRDPLCLGNHGRCANTACHPPPAFCPPAAATDDVEMTECLRTEVRMQQWPTERALGEETDFWEFGSL